MQKNLILTYGNKAKPLAIIILDDFRSLDALFFHAEFLNRMLTAKILIHPDVTTFGYFGSIRDSDQALVMLIRK